MEVVFQHNQILISDVIWLKAEKPICRQYTCISDSFIVLSTGILDNLQTGFRALHRTTSHSVSVSHYLHPKHSTLIS